MRSIAVGVYCVSVTRDQITEMTTMLASGRVQTFLE
ncbi:hypothetical protein ABAC460_06965 [Asticcacaulis sp. AC460]|nr:hypothetical protein ABAC460_06965 [Asticcacaulis sp. AC460]